MEIPDRRPRGRLRALTVAPLLGTCLAAVPADHPGASAARPGDDPRAAWPEDRGDLERTIIPPSPGPPPWWPSSCGTAPVAS